MAKKKVKKEPKKQGWDVFWVIRRYLKPAKAKYYLAAILSFISLGALGLSLRKTDRGKASYYRWGSLMVLAVCLLAIIYGIYILSYREKSYPRVVMAGMNVGSRPLRDIEKVVGQRVREFEGETIAVQYQDKDWELPLSDIKLSYDATKTARAVYGVGREKTFWRRLGSRLAALGRASKVLPVYSFDKEAFDGFVSKIAEDVDIPEKDATGVIKNNNVTFVQERTGLRVDKVALEKSIKRNFDNMVKKKVLVQVFTSHPKVTLGDTENARQQVLTMLKSKLSLKWQKGAWVVGTDTFSNWIKFKSVGVEGAPGQYQLTSYVDQQEVKSYLKKISKDIDGAPQNARLSMDANGVLTVTAPSKEGYVFDQDASLGPIIGAIQDGQQSDIELAVKVVEPDVTEANYMNLGIKEIVGSGATNFKGSSDARKHNIANGARIVTGTLIKPGEEFSTVKAIGNVDASSGFVQGLVIKGSQTIPEYGGGLCQVSSTLFRSALYSGLKITERKNHAYRVGYYETDGNGKYLGPGLDSTIYGPHPDLRFVNDTGAWILVQGRVEGNKLTFDFWGTKDGRVATISTPAISNVIPAPAAQYINTDTLFVGQTQQLEGSHPGATVVVNYSVVRGGQEINKQTFNSKFKPWGAKYLVGTKPVPVAPVPVPVATPVVETPPAPPPSL
ncbi:MAG: VanW family protein [bacterium]|nr:VanW family protein [bacterium]